MSRTTVINLHNPYLKFSAAHFTIFAAGQRERLHGHNFHVTAEITARVGDDGLCFDYNIMKRRLRELCERLDEYTLLPGRSPHLGIREDGTQVHITFGDARFALPADDVLILPVVNITAEELSHWLLERMLRDDTAEAYGITALSVAVASGPGQHGATRWVAGRGVL